MMKTYQHSQVRGNDQISNKVSMQNMINQLPSFPLSRVLVWNITLQILESVSVLG